ncbi:glyoxylate reductase [Aeropyrum pernix K1]|uniref:Glyoxylate reductase n=1 Tax=Aeropyrum pernix (strain ATCC 700893 / DSM 11879 / JCM 9820 / NBRC 100138 / K1) TaxID=272557 RepID=GYAR_AERPE|nr:glyoxylate reductase [Aeropyrum pernix]Q9YAW4.2 RecName: Full=Glyoxylate reductase [Aeropyrum pernix K1]BAA80834.2 glyoxylate reductase [Aeropyrum pernix K1]
MKRPRVFVTREVFPEALELLSKYYDVEVWDKYQPPPYETLLSKAREADALYTLLTDRIDCDLLSQAPRLRIVAQMAVGFDNIDVECATRLGIYVTNTPGVLTEATAEFTWALILAAARRVVEADHFVRWGEWWRLRTGWHPMMMLGVELRGKTLGILGMGRIGSRVAEIGKAFGMRIIYHSRSRKREIEKELGAEYRSLEDLLRESDILSIHLPLTDETRHLIGESELKLMKKTAILVNTGRGAIVDTGALVKALREGWIAAAALDVFEEEPLNPNHPLTAFKNVVLAPHAASATRETRLRMAMMAAENLVAFAQGKVPPNLVNREVVKVRQPGF